MQRKYLLMGVLSLLLINASRQDGMAQQYALDPAHTGVVFQASHLGISWTFGRFNTVSGTFRVDQQDPSNSSFNVVIKTESVDTGNQQRDEHLRSPDFFNVAQFPEIHFRSTSAKEVKGGLEVAGDLTLHGTTRPVTLQIIGGKTAEFPPGTKRVGYTVRQFKVKRSDFGMSGMLEAVGDVVYISASFEGVQP